ncbi:Centromere protein Scm3N-terminal [Penicillium sp. IBT 31633x]|nr:Centromere protein Scm3N-terminal [Penicillium sp. IBT 31633x]
MERPAKKPCLSYTPGDEEEAPPDFDLPAARAQNDSRLKSLFEGIFAKYSQDFTDVGDEIDLATGNIVVDNGHLSGLREEEDTGEQPGSWFLQAGLHKPTDTDGDDMKGEEEFFSLTPSPRGRSPEVLQEDPPLREKQKNADDSLDFVFTFKATGTTGLSPMSKQEYLSRPTEPIAPTKPQDPLWVVPDLPQPTPVTETRKTNAFPTSARSPSPPGSGSVWAVPRCGRPRTKAGPKATPSKRRSGTKRKSHSSPVTHDWSFAEIPDGNESDDPLQDYEPSPTPSKLKIIRGKRLVPTKDHDGPLAQRQQTHLEQPAFVVDDQFDYGELGCEGSVRDDAPMNQTDGTPEVKLQTLVPLDIIPQVASTPKAGTEALSPQPTEDTPSKRRPMTPDEAKLIVCMMHKEAKKASDVVPMLSGRDYQSIWSWFYNHWTRRLANPPPLSATWSQPELTILSRLSTQSGITWAQIQREFKGRTRNEVEFELLRAFVGEGFTSGIDEDKEEPVETEEQSQEEETQSSEDSIKEESESEGFDEQARDKEEDARASSHDTAQEGLEQPGIQVDNTASNSKATSPNIFLGVYINSSI